MGLEKIKIRQEQTFSKKDNVFYVTMKTYATDVNGDEHLCLVEPEPLPKINSFGEICDAFQAEIDKLLAALQVQTDEVNVKKKGFEDKIKEVQELDKAKIILPV